MFIAFGLFGFLQHLWFWRIDHFNYRQSDDLQ